LSVAGQLVVRLGFDDRDREVRLVGEKAVDLLARTAVVFRPTGMIRPSVKYFCSLIWSSVQPAS